MNNRRNATRIPQELLKGLLAAMVSVLSFSSPAQTAEVVVGDTVKTTTATPLMSQQTTLGVVPVGTNFVVEQVSGDWLLGRFDIGGKSSRGWVIRTKVSARGSATEGKSVVPLATPGAESQALQPSTQPKRPTVMINAGHGLVARAGFTAQDVLFSYSTEPTLRTFIWDHQLGRKVREIDRTIINPDGTKVLARGALRHVHNDSVIASITNDLTAFGVLTFSPTGKHYVLAKHAQLDRNGKPYSTGDHSEIVIFNGETGIRHAAVSLPSKSRVYACEFSPNGKLLLVLAGKFGLLVDVQTGSVASRFQERGQALSSSHGVEQKQYPIQIYSAFSGDSRRVLLSDGGRGFVVRDTRTQREWQVTPSESYWPTTIKHPKPLSFDGKLVMLTDSEGLSIYDVESGERDDELSELLMGQRHPIMRRQDPYHSDIGERAEVLHATFLKESNKIAAVYVLERNENGDRRCMAYIVDLDKRVKTSAWQVSDTWVGVTDLAVDEAGQWMSVLIRWGRSHGERLECLHWRTGTAEATHRLAVSGATETGGSVRLSSTDRWLAIPHEKREDPDKSTNSRTAYKAPCTFFDLDRGTVGGVRWIDLLPNADAIGVRFSGDDRVLLVENDGSSDTPGDSPAVSLTQGDDLLGMRVFEINREGAVISPDGEYCAVVERTRPDTVEVLSTSSLERIASLPAADLDGSGSRYMTFTPDSQRLVLVYLNMIRVWDTKSWDQIALSSEETDPAQWRRLVSPWVGSWVNDRVVRLFGDKGFRDWDVDQMKWVRSGNLWSGYGNPTSSLRNANRIIVGHNTGAVDDDSGFAIYDASKSPHRRAQKNLKANVRRLSSDGRLAVTVHSDGWTRIWDAETLTLLCRLLAFNEGTDWLVHTPEGLFDGSYSGRQKVFYLVGEQQTVVPVDRFFQDFYYPGLLASIWRGERPMPEVELGGELPPKLLIKSPEGGDADEREVLVTVTAEDTGGGIKGPWLKHNGARLLGSVVETTKEGDTTMRVFRVRLVEGENTLEAQGASADGGFESEPDRVTLRYAKPLPKPRLHLAMVAISDYADDQFDLKHPVRDLQRLASVFQQRGTALYEDVIVHPVLNEQATRLGIVRSIKALAEQVEPQDSVILALAGHGAVLDGRFAFVPYEFKRTDADLQEDLRNQALSADEISNAAATLPALKRLVIVDTGHSGMALPPRGKARNAFAFRGAVERLSRSQGLFVIAAASNSDTSREVEELGYNVLPYTLLAGLNAVDGGPLKNQAVQPASDDQVASAVEWFNFASSHSRLLSKGYFGEEQIIQYAASGIAFPVLPVSGAGQMDAPVIASVEEIFKTASKPTAALEKKRQRSNASDSGVFHVVAIGIGEYQQQSLNLRHAAADAEAMIELAKVQGASAHASIKSKLITNSDATAVKIKAALETLATSASENDTVLLHISGHGAMVGQRYYLIPHDFSESDGQLEDNIRKQGLPADMLGDLMAKIPAKRRMVVFDTCASGGALQLNKQGADPFDFRGALDRVSSSSGVFMIAAAGASEEAQEIDQLGHGVLTYSLLAAAGAVDRGPLLDKPAETANADGVLDVLEWFGYASGAVPRLMKQYFGSEQQVRLSGSGVAFPVLSISR